MKVNLLFENPEGCISGYVNVDPFAPDDDSFGRTKGDVSNLDHSFDDGECTEIIAHGILDYYHGDYADGVLGNWIKKLAHGGRLVVSVVDLREICRMFLSGCTKLEEINKILFGEQRKAWDFKKSVFTLDIIEEVLKNRGMKIISKRIHNHRLFIVCERP